MNKYRIKLHELQGTKIKQDIENKVTSQKTKKEKNVNMSVYSNVINHLTLPLGQIIQTAM